MELEPRLSYRDTHCQIKVVLVGKVMSGKTSMMLRFVKRDFMDSQKCTVGASFMSKTVKIADTHVKFDIWVRDDRNGHQL
jgi:GTPase SAR1 family protein